MIIRKRNKKEGINVRKELSADVENQNILKFLYWNTGLIFIEWYEALFSIFPSRGPFDENRPLQHDLWFSYIFKSINKLLKITIL